MSSGQAEKKANKSKTNPQYSATLRKIMLIDAIMEKRNDAYEEKLADYLKKANRLSANLTPEEISGLKVVFSQGYYSHEFKAMAEYDAIKKEADDLNALESRNDKQQARLEEISFYSTMPKETFVAHKLFDRSVIEKLKKSFPSANREISKSIKEISERKEFSKLPKNQRTRPATVAYFAEKYPNLHNDLAKMASTKDMFSRESANAGLAMLRYSSALTNPTGFLVSKAIGAMLKTETFQPLVKNVSKSIKNASEKTGLTKAAKRGLSSLSDVSLKRVATGVSVGCVGALLVVGIVEPEQAQELVQNMSESITSLGFDSANSALATSSNLISDGSDYTLMDQVLGGESPSGGEPLAEGAPKPSGSEPLPEAIEKPSGAVEESTVLTQPDPEVLSDKSEPLVEGGKPERTVLEVIGDAPDKTVEPDVSVQQSYIVQPGDTMSEIIESKLQEAGVPYDYNLISDYLDVVKEMNDIDNIDEIRPNQEFKMPAFTPVPEIVDNSVVNEFAANSVVYDENKFTPRVVDFASSTTGQDFVLENELRNASGYAFVPPNVSVEEVSNSYGKRGF